MTKAERLALAAAEAPILRNASEKALARRVHVVDRDGNVIRYASGREVLKGLARAHELEHAVEDGKRPKIVTCVNCGKDVPVGRGGMLPKVCSGCRGAQHNCVGWGDIACAAEPKPIDFSACRILRRKGEPWRCRDCSIRKTHAVTTREKRSAGAHRAAGRKTLAERGAAARKASGSLKKRYATLSNEERRNQTAAARAANARRASP